MAKPRRSTKCKWGGSGRDADLPAPAPPTFGKRSPRGESVSSGEVPPRATFLDSSAMKGQPAGASRIIKSVAARDRRKTLLLYRKTPPAISDDAILLYGPGSAKPISRSDHLRNARKVCNALLNGYRPRVSRQTLGYLAEVEETVYGEVGGLERALDLYRRAALLNRDEIDPDNRANLELNLGQCCLFRPNATRSSITKNASAPTNPR